ncbi:hypothetical protein HMPREF9630_00681 [Peptoanaerobacter stomatis]|uniref:Glycosyl transferase family 1 domain-containing protein n=1 Tax=Peptoanaerobacter stomatis TaxID=796937 RepID=V9HNJ6_9FIRM|nr:glycosyltransferase [Peptoanaerobacter stomatis]EHL15312.1 hypothetical protein HMPREF9630_00681 [Peptoanaerobacter stomatis]
MKKVAFFTPLHPLKSGIADYAEEMLPYIKNRFQVDLFIDSDYEASEEVTKKNHYIYIFEDFVKLRESYDVVIYQMGNNNYHEKIYEYLIRYPGIVVLHDYAIHHLIAHIFYNNYKSDVKYFDEVLFNHGEEAKNIAYKRACNGEMGLWETDAVNYPMNKRILSKSISLITFSEFSKQNLESYNLGVPIKRIYLHCGGEPKLVTENEKNMVRKKYGIEIDSDEYLFCVFGFVTPSKRPYSIIEAFSRVIDSGKKAKLIFVGEVHDACKDLKTMVDKKKLTKRVKFTGFTDIDTFKDYLIASDFCISLRYPTMGETSGVLMRALSMGKPSIVTNIGTFKEFSDEMVIKISYKSTEIDELENAITKLISDKNLVENMKKLSYEYAQKYLSIEDTANDFCDFVEDTIKYKNVLDNEYYRYFKTSIFNFTANYDVPGNVLENIFDCNYETFEKIFDERENYEDTCFGK